MRDLILVIVVILAASAVMTWYWLMIAEMLGII